MKYVAILISFLIISGCTSNTDSYYSGEVKNSNEVSAAEEYLQKHSGTDLFQKGGIVYTNASDISWIMESEFSKGVFLGRIEKQTSSDSGFENLTSNFLPVGTKLYDAEGFSGDVIIAETEKGDIPYLGLREG
ncbi:hypothetical protein E3U55_07440 [Filobacillus milosensis]|uniref:Lipoprotein n=1 Tax=Filobacillus milosensis TaxID=94137 RepID=A0A4Y8INL5_9BACI|nr:hypothetical protein [Filobacillus milosensis]TFB22127.1 hypothetical protein E3U55_07440 [Filobacillus milosensis]